MKKRVAIIGTMDTKREEVALLKRVVEFRGHDSVVVDVGPLGPPLDDPDFSNEKVARMAGRDLADLRRSSDRGQVMEIMGRGAASLLLKLYRDNQLDGVIGIGGNQGTAMASQAMKVLPLGFPKYLVSTVASGNIRPYVGSKDIGMVFSVSDLIGGPNPVTRSVLTNAAAQLIGMVECGERIAWKGERQTTAISALGNTEPAVSHAVQSLKEKGFQALAFHASGAGGSAMEELIESGLINGVLDLTPHELTEEVIAAGAYLPVRRGRLTAAGLLGIPQIVS